jgi:hypothetical protein
MCKYFLQSFQQNWPFFIKREMSTHIMENGRQHKTNLCAACNVQATSWAPLILSTKLPYFTTPPNSNPNNVSQPQKMTGTIIHLHMQLVTALEMVIINWITCRVSWIFFSTNCNTNLFSICYCCCCQIHLETYSNDLLCITFSDSWFYQSFSNINPVMKKYKSSHCINWIWLPVIFLVAEALVENLALSRYSGMVGWTYFPLKKTH